MSFVPKLKISGLGWGESGELYDFERAQYLPFDRDMVITADNNIIHSYEDLVELSKSEPFRTREFLEITFLPIIVGG
jgi:hypothetical protein